jgi:hypothetical protein
MACSLSLLVTTDVEHGVSERRNEKGEVGSLCSPCHLLGLRPPLYLPVTLTGLLTPGTLCDTYHVGHPPGPFTLLPLAYALAHTLLLK